MSKPLASTQESYFSNSQDPSHSFQPSESDVSPFSVPLGAPVMASHMHVKEGGNIDGENLGVFEQASMPAKDHIGM